MLLLTRPRTRYQRAEVGQFVDGITAGSRPVADGAGSPQSLRAIWRLYEAERSGRYADRRGLGLDTA